MSLTDDIPHAIRPYWRFLGAMMPVIAPIVYSLASVITHKISIETGLETALVGSFSALWGLYQRNPFSKLPQPPTDKFVPLIAIGIISGTLLACVMR